MPAPLPLPLPEEPEEPAEPAQGALFEPAPPPMTAAEAAADRARWAR